MTETRLLVIHNNTCQYVKSLFLPFLLSPAHVRPPRFFPELCYINRLLPSSTGIHPGVRSIKNLIPVAKEMLEQPLEVECGAGSDSDIPKHGDCCCFPVASDQDFKPFNGQWFNSCCFLVSINQLWMEFQLCLSLAEHSTVFC